MFPAFCHIITQLLQTPFLFIGLSFDQFEPDKTSISTSACTSSITSNSIEWTVSSTRNKREVDNDRVMFTPTRRRFEKDERKVQGTAKGEHDTLMCFSVTNNVGHLRLTHQLHNARGVGQPEKSFSKTQGHCHPTVSFHNACQNYSRVCFLKPSSHQRDECFLAVC